jgi:hypothetical protein
MPMRPELWLHMERRLVSDIDKEIDAYLDGCKAVGMNVIPSMNKEVAAIRMKGVHKYFLKTERDNYAKTVKI